MPNKIYTKKYTTKLLKIQAIESAHNIEKMDKFVIK